MLVVSEKWVRKSLKSNPIYRFGQLWENVSSHKIKKQAVEKKKIKVRGHDPRRVNNMLHSPLVGTYTLD